jgi:hypothetical protein
MVAALVSADCSGIVREDSKLTDQDEKRWIFGESSMRKGENLAAWGLVSN